MNQNHSVPYGTMPVGYSPYWGVNPIQQESHSIRRLGNIIGFTVVGFFAMQFVAAFLLLLSGAYPMYLEGDIAYQAINIFTSILCVFFPFAVLMLSMRSSQAELLPLGKIKLSLFIPLVFVGMSIFVISNIATNMLITVMGFGGIELVMPNMTKPTTTGGIILSIVSTAVIPALTEEFAMRGVVLQILRKHGDGFAIVMSSLLFAVMHGNFVQAPFAFIGGLALGYCAVKTGSLWLSITIHFLNNLMAVLFDVFQKPLGENLYMILNYSVFIGILIAGIVSIIYLIKKQPDFFHLKDSVSFCTFKQKVDVFLATPGVVISFVLIGLLSMQFLEITWLS